jgi:hypothetical protein
VYTFNDNASSAPTVEVKGTTDSTSPGTDTVDINCYSTVAANGINHSAIATNVPLNPTDGTFDWTGPVATENTCTLRAVPHNYGNKYPLTQFSGPFSVLNYTRQDQVSGGSHQTGPFEDFYYSASSTNAYDDYESVGACGLDDAQPIMLNGDFADSGSWNCAAALYGGDGSGTRSEIKIGNNNAYDSASAANAFPGADTKSGFQPLTSSYSSSASSSNPGGDVSISESENLVSCPGGVQATNSAACPSWSSTGVSFARSISQTNGGQVVTITDKYTSTDGASHNLDVEYDNYSNESGDAAWKLPGSSQYEFYSPGDQATLPNTSTNVIETDDGYYNDGGFDAPGALIYNTQPNLAQFIGSCCGNSSQEMLLDYQRTVPAGGSMAITQTYMVAPDQGSLDKMVNAVLDSVNKPTVSITSPANNMVTSASSVQVSGKASANEGLSLKVNGAAVPVNSGGTWSTSVSLNNGANTIAAVASDGSGNTAQASETVYYNLSGAFCIVPTVSKMKLSQAEQALKAAGCNVGRIHKVRSRKGKKGRVLHASYGASTVLRYGSTVGLTVSKGKPKNHKHDVRFSWHVMFGARRS